MLTSELHKVIYTVSQVSLKILHFNVDYYLQLSGDKSSWIINEINYIGSQCSKFKSKAKIIFLGSKGLKQ